MRKLLYSILIAASVTACSHRPDSNDRLLAAADSALSEHPDSTLSIIQSIDPRSLSRGQTALMALLTAKACDKASLPQPGDSLLSLAVNRFRWQGDSIEVQALYYRGLGQSQRGELIEALYSLHEAYDKAITTSNHFYAAMSAREICSVYTNTYTPTEQLKWSRLAKQHFTLANKPVHAAWMSIEIMHALVFTGHFDNAKEYWDSIDAQTYSSAPAFRHHMLIERIELANQLSDFDDMTFCYDSLKRDGYKLKAHDYCRLAQVSINKKNFDEAAVMLGLASDNARRPVDSMHIQKLLSILLYNIGEFKKAAEASSNAYFGMAKTTDNILLNPANSVLLENLELKSEKYRAIVDKQKSRIHSLLAICCVIIVIAGITVLYLRARIKIKRIEMDRNIARIKTLQQEIASKQTELASGAIATEKIKNENNLLTTTNHEHKKIIQTLSSEINEVLSMHLTMFDDICRAYYGASGSKIGSKTAETALRTILKKLTDGKTAERIMNLIDIHDNSWMTRFRNAYPELKDKEYTLAAYIYLNLSTEAIATLIGKDNPNKVYIEKKRLREHIKEICGGKKDEFTIKLGVKL
jgi:hypothetical protein